MVEINVEEIMQELKAEIAKRSYTDKILSFDDVGDFTGIGQASGNINAYSFEEMTRQCNNVNAQYNVLEYRIYPSNGFANKVKTFIKKALRKPIRFYINPIVHDQNEFNSSVTRCINQMRLYMAENQDLKKQVHELSEQVKKLQSQIKNSNHQMEEKG